MVSFDRCGVRHVHAEAPVHVREHEHTPRARREDPERVVTAARDGVAQSLRGESGGPCWLEDYSTISLILQSGILYMIGFIYERVV